VYLNQIQGQVLYRTGGLALLKFLAACAFILILVVAVMPIANTHLIKSRRSEAKVALIDLARREQLVHALHGMYSSDPIALGYSGTGDGLFPMALAYSGSSHYTLSMLVDSGQRFTAVALPTGGQRGDGACFAYQIDQSGTHANINAHGGRLTDATCW